MAKTSQSEKVSKTITSLTFSKDNPIDQPLISAANRFISLPENEGISPTPVLRNFFKRALDARLNGTSFVPRVSSSENGGQS